MQINVNTDKVRQIVSAKPMRPASERPVFVGTDWFAEITRLISEFVGDHMVAVLIDDEVARLYPDRLEALKDALPRVRIKTIKGGESAKTVESFTGLLEYLLQSGMNHDDCLISIGGGTITDVAGFIAAVYSRGIHWISMPTTFMAQFDCAVGGKTGINMHSNKNFCGTFYEPNIVCVDTSFLKTLPDRFFMTAVSELAKLALLGNEPLFRKLQQSTVGGINAIKADIENIIVDAMRVKVGITSTDPFQEDVRVALLTGHTTAHALEGASKMHLHHGEALAIGLAFESFIAEKRGLIEGDDRRALVDIMENCQLSTVLPPELHDRTLIDHMRREKRNRGRLISLVLPYKPGRAIQDWPEPHVMLTPDQLWDELVAYRMERG